MTLSTLPKWARRLIDDERVGRLGLLDADANPRVLPITYAVGADAIWSAIDRTPKRLDAPARVRWLRERPQAALTIDRYDDDWSRLAWVQVLGTVAVLDTESAPEGLELLAARYEPYRFDPPPGPLLRLDVERALCWRSAHPD